MKRGSYSKKVDFDTFKVRKFRPHIFGGPGDSGFGCGASAISLLTGMPPRSIPKPKRGNWTEKYVLKYLHAKKFNIVELTMRNVTGFEYLSYPVSTSHVTLLRLKFIRGEASWAVTYNKTIYHNFEIVPMKPYEFLNHPIMAAYLVKHPKWAVQKKSGFGFPLLGREFRLVFPSDAED